jgi:hypothetical protein
MSKLAAAVASHSSLFLCDFQYRASARRSQNIPKAFPQSSSLVFSVLSAG